LIVLLNCFEFKYSNSALPNDILGTWVKMMIISIPSTFYKLLAHTRTIYVLTVWVCNDLAKGNGAKGAIAKT